MEAGSGPHLTPNKGLLIHPEVPFDWGQGRCATRTISAENLFSVRNDKHYGQNQENLQ
jgi:hypothetical protein